MKELDPTLDALARSMDVRLLRHTLLSANVANADTPGYAPADVDFHAALDRAAAAPERTHPDHLAAEGGAPAPVVERAAEPGPDGNAVEVEREMALLAENGLLYGAAARAVQKKLAILRYVASDGTST